MPHLVLVATGATPVRGGTHVELSDKTISGLNFICSLWRGDVTIVSAPTDVDEAGNIGSNWYKLTDLPFRFVLGEPKRAVPLLKPDVIQGSLSPSHEWLLHESTPVVLVAENPAMAGFVLTVSTGLTPQFPRIALGACRHAVRLRRMASAAQGLACNGWAAWNAYGDRSRAAGGLPILFFDTRLSRAAVYGSGLPIDTGPLSLAFSGRFHPAKGPQFAVSASNRLAEAGVRHSLRMYGRGPMESSLRRSAGPQVDFRGALTFNPDWTHEVRANVNLMVLPHIQGDPAGTYLESAGLGVPVLGFKNRAMRGHSDELGIGWAVPTYSTAALVRKLRDLDQQRDEIQRAATAGVDFMRCHAFEDEFARRVDHLAQVARYPGGVRSS